MRRESPLFAAALFLFAAIVATNNNSVLAQQQQRGVGAAAQIGGSVSANITIPKLEFLSPLESEIVAEINLARAQPQVYASYLEETKKFYSGNQIRRPGRAVEVTVEGLTALDEAIAFLRAAQPLPPLQVYKGMSLAAKDHSRDLGTSGNTGHRGSDGSTPNIRASRYGDWTNNIGENIVYQAMTSARESVMGLIIDDGIATRGHRKNIFDATYRAAGIAIGERSNLGTLCVITFAGGFTDKASPSATTPTSRPAARKY
ncbi:MAG TPA: CAP domain-containing protein [Pyrinomonadaceae bacterium]|jgi:uncharacterized protein YkwD